MVRFDSKLIKWLKRRAWNDMERRKKKKKTFVTCYYLKISDQIFVAKHYCKFGDKQAMIAAAKQ